MTVAPNPAPRVTEVGGWVVNESFAAAAGITVIRRSWRARERAIDEEPHVVGPGRARQHEGDVGRTRSAGRRRHQAVEILPREAVADRRL